MKQTRKNIFETNSSSTHSITINDIISTKDCDLLVDDVLYVGRLNIIEDNDYYTTRIIACRTYEEKLALVAAYIHELE